MRSVQRFLAIGVAVSLAISLFWACSDERPPPEVLAEARALLAPAGKSDPPGAAARIEQAYGPAPSDPEAAFLLAQANFRSDRPGACRVALDAYFACAPKDRPEWTAEAWVLRGWLSEREGKPADAMPHYRKALEIAPDYAWAMQRLGSALADTGDLDDLPGAIGWVEKAIAKRPALLEAHFTLARLYRQANRPVDAEREATIHRLLNQTNDNTANTRESAMEKFAAYSELETLLPQWIEGRLTLTQMQLKIGRREQALERLRRLVAEHPESEAARQLLASIERPQR